MNTNEACFNDLSVHPFCQTTDEAIMRLKTYIRVLKGVRSHAGIKKIRYSGDLTATRLTEDMTVQDYINQNSRSSEALLLLSTVTHPQVDVDIEPVLERYLETTTRIKIDENDPQEADGFNAAFCQNTFCVGFASRPFWHDDFFDISVTNNIVEEVYRWGCISSSSFYDGENAEKRKNDFDKWLQSIRPVSLQSCPTLPADKKISLRNDHGKDKLLAHAKSLCNNEYVVGILTSLEFRPHCDHYIYDIKDDGTIDMVLFWEEAGYSMRVKTTGRNLKETLHIAELLKQKYGRR